MSIPPPTNQQRRIVEYPLEPLRIAAGAGTGKTSTIVARLVAAIEEGMAPEQALGITFTNKAAEELADRLRSAMPEYAVEGREVEVTTYHGFAFSLLQEFGAFVGVERDTEVVGPGYIRQLLLQGLDGNEFEHLDLTAPNHRVAEAATLAAQLGDNLTDTADLRSLCERESGDVWGSRMELCSIIDAYESAKWRLGVVDYADLIHLAYRLVSTHDVVAARVRSRYRLVLLDEYQDTAPAQREFLRSLFGTGFPITAVGDADQTIYEWRGASLANFEAFPDHFARDDGPAETLSLTVNHRSARRILDVANTIRRHLHGDEFEQLIPPTDTDEGHVEARWFRDAVTEALWIADEARRLHDEENLQWRDIAVLFRKNRQISLVRDAFQSAAIPVEVASLGGLLDVPEVADLHAWLRVLHDPEDEPALLRILLGARYRLGLGDLAPLAARRLNRSATEGGVPHRRSMIEVIDRLDEVDGLPDEARVRLVEFRSCYRDLLVAAQGVALDDLCRRILEQTEAWADVEAMPDAAGLSARLNLYRFLDLAQGWSPLEGRSSLGAFVGYLELLTDEQAAEELDTARVGGEDAVSLLTVHRAKGLEWNAVFLPALAQDVFPARSLGYDNPDRYARYLPYELRLDAHTLPTLEGTKKDRDARLRAHHLAAEWRTAYVGVTRAKQRLYLSGAWWYTTKRPRPPSQLFELVSACPSVAVTCVHERTGSPPRRLTVDDVAGAPDPLFEHGWAAAVRATLDDPEWPRRHATDELATYDARVEQLRLMVTDLPAETADPAPADAVPSLGNRGISVTGLVTLASCPQRYYWSEVDRLPRRPSKGLRRGVEVHRRIELHNLGRVAFDDLTDGLYDVADPSEEVTESDPAQAMLPPFEAFLASRFAAQRPLFVETPIDLQLSGRRLRGRIDAVYRTPDGWEIVDFKSGRNGNDPVAVVQLQAYAVAATRGAIAPSRPDELTVTFAYLGGGAVEEVAFAADDRWVREAERNVTTLMELAGGDDFAPRPSVGCRRCDFLAFCDEGRKFVGDTAT